MSFQLIFTSSPRGLTLGRSGFCTVARHREISESLVTALERWSAFERPEDSTASLPVIHAYRILRLGSATFHVLTRIQEAGVDYTQRGNHLAQHLIFLPQELKEIPTPADVFLNWNGWINNWAEAPRYLEAADQPLLASVSQAVTLPASTWQSLTGDAAHAALLAQANFQDGVVLASASPSFEESLRLFGESLILTEVGQSSTPSSWSVPFTTHLQTHDLEEEFSWIAADSNVANEIAARKGVPVLSLESADWPPIKSSSLAKQAREGGAAAKVFKDTSRLPDLSSLKEDPELKTRALRQTHVPRNSSPSNSSSAPKSPRVFVVSAIALLLIVLGIGWSMTRSSAPAPASSISTQLARLQTPGKRDALRQFLRENPATSGNPEDDSALEKAARWLEASDYLEQLQFLRRQEQVQPLQEALQRVQNLPQLADLKTNLPQLGYEMEEAQNWLLKKTQPPTPQITSAVPEVKTEGLAHFFGPTPAVLSMLSPEKTLSLSGIPEAAAWLDNSDRNPSRMVRILPLDKLPLQGEGTTAKPQLRRNRESPFRFYQGVHLLFEIKVLDESVPSFELTFSGDSESVSPPGTFGRALQFEDAGKVLFSIFILKPGQSEPLLRLPRSMIEFDPDTHSHRLRKDVYADAKITLGDLGTASLEAPSSVLYPGSALSNEVSWQKLTMLETPSELPVLALYLRFPDTEGKILFLQFEGEAAP